MSTPPGTRSAEAHIREVFRRLFDERDLSDPSAFWSDTSYDEFLADRWMMSRFDNAAKPRRAVKR